MLEMLNFFYAAQWFMVKEVDLGFYIIFVTCVVNIVAGWESARNQHFVYLVNKFVSSGIHEHMPSVLNDRS
jgi:hypothetical protein